MSSAAPAKPAPEGLALSVGTAKLARVMVTLKFLSMLICLGLSSVQASLWSEDTEPVGPTCMLFVSYLSDGSKVNGLITNGGVPVAYIWKIHGFEHYEDRQRLATRAITVEYRQWILERISASKGQGTLLFRNDGEDVGYAAAKQHSVNVNAGTGMGPWPMRAVVQIKDFRLIPRNSDELLALVSDLPDKIKAGKLAAP